MEIDWEKVRRNFREMTREALLEEMALRAGDYTPLAREHLEEEARSRGITDEEIRRFHDRRRGPVVDEGTLVLVASFEDEALAAEVRDLLGRRSVTAELREVDPHRLRSAGCPAGKIGLFVLEGEAGTACRILEELGTPNASEAGCRCGGEEPPPGEWPEDGDWWRTDPAGEEDSGERGGKRG